MNELTSPTAVERLIAFYRANPMAHPAELLEVTEALLAERDTALQEKEEAFALLHHVVSTPYYDQDEQRLQEWARSHRSRQ